MGLHYRPAGARLSLLPTSRADGVWTTQRRPLVRPLDNHHPARRYPATKQNASATKATNLDIAIYRPLFPPPALGERRHRRLACRRV